MRVNRGRSHCNAVQMQTAVRRRPRRSNTRRGRVGGVVKLQNSSAALRLFPETPLLDRCRATGTYSGLKLSPTRLAAPSRTRPYCGGTSWNAC